MRHRQGVVAVAQRFPDVQATKAQKKTGNRTFRNSRGKGNFLLAASFLNGSNGHPHTLFRVGRIDTQNQMSSPEIAVPRLDQLLTDPKIPAIDFFPQSGSDLPGGGGGRSKRVPTSRRAPRQKGGTGRAFLPPRKSGSREQEYLSLGSSNSSRFETRDYAPAWVISNPSIAIPDP